MKKTITGQEAIKLIEEAAAIIVMDEWQAVVYPSVEWVDDDFVNVDIVYDPENGFIHKYSFKIFTDDEIEVRDNQLFLTDHNVVDKVGIKLLEIKDLKNERV